MLLAFTTKAEAATDLSAYNKKLYVKATDGFYHLFLSKNSNSSITTRTIPISSYITDFNTGDYNNPTQPIEYYYAPTGSNNIALHLIYNGVSWEVFIPPLSQNPSAWLFLPSQFVSSSSTSPLSGFPEVNLDSITLEEVESTINTKLNETTSASTEAASVQQNITNNYYQYTNGDLSLTELQSQIADLQSQLEELNSRTDTTLADKVAITNATLQVQIVQEAANKDEIIQELQTDLKVSSTVSTAITGKINEANQTFQNYSQGSITQTEAVTQIKQYITHLTSQITPETPTADIEAINTAINTINGIKDSITSHSDLNNTISEKSQNSDKEEMEYLEDLEAETTDTIDSLKTKVDNSISQDQANQVKENVITPLLENTIIVKLLPIAALFMVLAVTLGFKYRL